jgi:hypothetical protein
MKSKCNSCKRESKQTEGWWKVNELLREYYLCPACYRNKSLVAYRETLLELIQAIDTKDEDHGFTIAMEVMKLRCIAVVRDTKFND